MLYQSFRNYHAGPQSLKTDGQGVGRAHVAPHKTEHTKHKHTTSIQSCGTLYEVSSRQQPQHNTQHTHTSCNTSLCAAYTCGTHRLQSPSCLAPVCCACARALVRRRRTRPGRQKLHQTLCNRVARRIAVPISQWHQHLCQRLLSAETSPRSPRAPLTAWLFGQQTPASAF